MIKHAAVSENFFERLKGLVEEKKLKTRVSNLAK